MTAAQWLGALIIAAVVAGIFVVITVVDGIEMAVKVYLTLFAIVAVVALTVFGIFLLAGDLA
jgi:hypothetical protein